MLNYTPLQQSYCILFKSVKKIVSLHQILTRNVIF